MWEYIRPRDQSIVADDHLPKESMTRVAWMVLGSMSGEPVVDDGPSLFSMFKLRPDNLLFLGEVSVPLSTRGQGAEVDPDSPSPPPGACHRVCP